MTVTIKTKNQPAKSPKPAPSPGITVLQKVIKGDSYLVIADSARELEDEFVNLYYVQGQVGGSLAVSPPYPPKTLKHLARHNNILNQCIQAMEVNIDGTGHEFVKVDDTEIDEAEIHQARAFFAEPYPGKSFISQRRLLRQDLESIGYGYLEILRTMDDTIAGVRYAEAQTLRMVRLGEAVDMKYLVSRGGKEITLTIKERPRRYMQTFNGTSRTYFKDFGVPLDLDKVTGEWAKEGEKLPAERRAGELLYFGVDKDHTGPYSVPRWINQLPSVLGSRKAEETNLEWFDSGGMPPAIIFIQGGQMVGDASNQLRTYLAAGNRKKGRAVVVELASNSGSLDSTGTVSARVERFQNAGDVLYDKYDLRAEEHVRVGFRLPPLFIGRNNDFSYATAQISYQIAEAQVFQPERTEFDEIINKTLMKGLGFKTIRFRSLPITMKSIDDLLKALPIVVPFSEGEGVINIVNTSLGLDLKYKKPEPAPAPGAPPPIAPQEPVEPEAQGPLVPPPKEEPTKPKPKPDEEEAVPQPEDVAKPEAKKKAEVSTLDLLTLVRRTAEASGLVEPLLDLGPEDRVRVSKSVEELGADQRYLFDQLLTQYCIPVHQHDH